MPLEGHWARVNTPLRKTTLRERRILWIVRRGPRRGRDRGQRLWRSAQARPRRPRAACESSCRARWAASALDHLLRQGGRSSFCAGHCRALPRPLERDSPAEVPRGRVLTERELNRALLARQLLLERVKVPHPQGARADGHAAGPVRALDVHRPLVADRRDSSASSSTGRSSGAAVAQGTLMRATIHLVSAADYWPIAIGVRRGRREAWLGASYRKDYSAKQMSAAARKLRKRLGDGTMGRKEIHELLGSDSVVTNGVNMWLDLVARAAHPGPGSAGGPTSTPRRVNGWASRRRSSMSEGGNRAAGAALSDRIRPRADRRHRQLGRPASQAGRP